MSEIQAVERPHIIAELGLAVRRVASGLDGTASISDLMCLPGTSHLRASILAAWADQLCGLMAVSVISPRVPVTLQLDVQLTAPPPGSGQITGRGKVTKAGRSVVFAAVEFSDDDGLVFAVCSGSFMAAPDVTLEMPSVLSFEAGPPTQVLRVPFAERAGCQLRHRGTATLPIMEDGRNAAQTLNGGLIALAAEEAVLSLLPGTSLSSMSIQFLRAVRVGPAVATARVISQVGHVEVADEGLDGRVAAIVLTRCFDQ